MLQVEIEKLVHGGQGLGTADDGRKVFVWGALPGEKAEVRIIKKKKSYIEAIAENIMVPSPVRVKERESNYLATSPWQIVDFDSENDYKKRIVEELFIQAHVTLPEFVLTTAGDDWHYRNKMEYSFWGDDDGLHLALHNRGSHQKTIVEGSELAMKALDAAAQSTLAELRKNDPRAGDLKTIIIRCNQDGEAVVALFTKLDTFVELELPAGVKGLRVYHSNPQSPASVPTRLLYELGNATLQDKLQGRTFTYDVDSFFQVNLEVFDQALARIKEHFSDQAELVDMYAGTGSIGLSVASRGVDLIELDPATVAMARVNADASDLDVTVVETAGEKALDYITSQKPIIFDPPRSGLHDKVIARTLEAKPPRIAYLSCNPATQASDLVHLTEAYKITYFEAFNFFPHTPHIETLAILELKSE